MRDEKFVDAYENELNIGDSIVSGTHPSPYNKSIKMRKGVIVKINECMITCYSEDGEEFRCFPDKCVKVEKL